MRIWRPLALAACSLLVHAGFPLGGDSAIAEDYLPLGLNNQWFYENDLGESDLMTIIGERTVLGVTTRVRVQDEATDLFENYWTQDDGGNLYLHGARNFMSPFEVAYLPPLLMVDAPLSLDKAWVTHDVRLYDLDGAPWNRSPFDYGRRVYFEGPVTVPAGTFYVYGVGFDPDSLLVRSPDGRTYDIFGRRLETSTPTQYDITDWYSDHLGLAQMTVYADEQHPLQLVSTNLPTPVGATTWGRVKALFWGTR